MIYFVRITLIAFALWASLLPSSARASGESVADFVWTTNGLKFAIEEGAATFFGEARGDFFDLRRQGDPILPLARRVSMVDQFRFAFEGVPYPEFRVGKGYRAFVVGVPHSATERVAAITGSQDRRLLAVAFQHSNCGRLNGLLETDSDWNRIACEGDPRITVVFPRKTVDSLYISRLIVQKLQQDFRGNRTLSEAYRSITPEVMKSSVVYLN